MRAIAASITTACLAACDPLVDADYSGDALFRLQGVASSTRGEGVTTTGVKGAALWQATSSWGMTAFTRLPLSVEFPAFWIDVISLPRDEVLFELAPGEPAIAEAYLHIVKPDTGSAPRADDFLATEYGHALVYVSAELPPSGMTAGYLSGNLAPGFHVMTRTSLTELTVPQQLLVERCVALAVDTPPDRARASCTVQHLYRLEPAPDDLTTILRFHVEPPST
jgi:hypothetical protein